MMPSMAAAQAMPDMGRLPAEPVTQANPTDHANHDEPGNAKTGMLTTPAMAGMAGTVHSAHHHMLNSAFGAYPGNRDASGTSWQPDTSPHYGLHGEYTGWGLMLHGTVNVVYDRQSGPRGDKKAFVLGHVMGAAARDLSARDRLQFRVAVTPDPLMGPRGYPL